jgi:hypothetical protein
MSRKAQSTTIGTSVLIDKFTVDDAIDDTQGWAGPDRCTAAERMTASFEQVCRRPTLKDMPLSQVRDLRSCAKLWYGHAAYGSLALRFDHEGKMRAVMRALDSELQERERQSAAMGLPETSRGSLPSGRNIGRPQKKRGPKRKYDPKEDERLLKDWDGAFPRPPSYEAFGRDKRDGMSAGDVYRAIQRARARRRSRTRG